MSGTENIITHGDPYRKKVIACEEVSFTIVVPMYNRNEGKNGCQKFNI
jgi:hypothetical protein